MTRPFIFVGSAMFISLFIYSYLGIQTAVAVFAVCFVVTLLSYLLRRKHGFFKAVFLMSLAVVVSSTVFTAKTVNGYMPALNLCTDEKAVVSGVLIEQGKYYDNHYYVLKNVSVNGAESDCRIRITGKYKAAETDDLLTFSVTGVNAVSDTQSRLRYNADGIYLTAYSNESVKVEKAEKHSVLYYLDEFKKSVSGQFDDSLDKDSSSAVTAMVTGDTSGLDAEILQNFRYSGIAHLFAVSGFHLSLWTSVIYFCLRKIFGIKNNIVFAVSAVFILFFMAFTGFTQSVVRAGIMQLVFLLGGVVKYKSDSLNSLFFALTVILCINPFAVMSISLHMSFLATLGIVTLSQIIMKPVKKADRKSLCGVCCSAVSSLYITAAISVTATIFTLPVSVLNFEYYSFAAPLTNVLCMPVAELVMPLSCLGLAFSKIPVFSTLIGFVCNFIMKYVFFITEKIADCPFAVVDAKSVFMKISVVLLTLFIIVALTVFSQKQRKLAISLCACVLSFVVLSVSAETFMYFTHEVTVAPVGNGISVLYRTADKNIIIGCGGEYRKSYLFTNLTSAVNAENFDLIIIPGASETESGYAGQLLRMHKFEKCIISQEKYDDINSKKLPDDTKITSKTNIIIDGKCNIVYINDERFSGVRITDDTFSCTILFCPVADFSCVPEEWLTGDLLVTRQNLPEADISGFETVFVSTCSKTPFDNENLYTTIDNGTLIFRAVPWGGKQIYADF